MPYDLQLIKVGKVYDNGTPAVIDFDLDVEKGEFVAFLGPSGCGKTTTLRMIGGFETITSGDVRIRGRRVNELPPERRPTSMIFQNYALFPHLDVRRNVAYGLEVKGMPKAERDAKVDRMLATLGIADVAAERPDRLSGGQRQRIALARSLVVEPDILLLDEPLGALDANLRKTIQAELRLLQRNLGITFVFVTHAQSEALTLSDRIVVMNEGRIEQVSPPHQLYTRPKTRFVAQFIGRNTIFSGTLDAIEQGLGSVATQLGRFTGTLEHPAVAGEAAEIVVPSEAFGIYPCLEASHSALVESYRGNVLQGVITEREVVGHIVQLAVKLAGDRVVAIEGHVEKYLNDGLAPGSAVWIAWAAKEATVIRG
ncbi:putative spermidine/putrescine transport system ATP-binding protein/spermidine/putrescine transport system ATP-binding protein [Rhizobiales bacterium GAS191]|nr:putative spermidine/putrescine transport system ATP-binding protein/spermidine/putrescine transport system ATP-binding protein [Rhizobiales bacterium GAS113]SEB86755.1 putative spermidine/putrescine transport system ATP-binding protein/spermidine/putrescine transport system ATP-binding protein [Rhizobiales bacterium GAS191]